jgi:hypothetical protein
MKTPMLAAIATALLAAACVDSNESFPEVYPTEFPPSELPASWGPGLVYPVSDVTSEQQLALSGHLDGTLRGIALSADTTQNYGTFTVYEGAPAFFSASIAAPGDRGAGMLIISLTETGLREKLLDGQWSSSAQVAASGEVFSSVTSCAGPTIGEWPYEIGSVDYEMDATEDPAQPGTVVLAVKAHFPRSESDISSTTELTGTLRFELAAVPD